MLGKVMEIIGLFIVMVGLSCADSEPVITWIMMMLVSLIGMGIFYVGIKIEKEVKVIDE